MLIGAKPNLVDPAHVDTRRATHCFENTRIEGLGSKVGDGVHGKPDL
jgi:hypothetical protein